MIPVEVAPGDSPVILGLPHTGTWLPDDIRARLNARGQVLADTDALGQVLRVLAARVRNGELPADLAADARELARAIGTQTPTSRNDVSLLDQWLNEMGPS